MAAICGGIGMNKRIPADVIHLNLKMGCNVFDAIHKYGTKYVYTIGSVCSYPQDCPIPFKEDDLWKGYPETTNAGYGFSKLALLMLQQEYRKQYNLRGAHFLLGNMYGEYDNFDLNDSHVIPALIRKFTEAVEENKPEVYCWGSGMATREFLYVGDCAQAITKAVTSKFDSELPINIGTGDSISIKKLATLIGNLCGWEHEWSDVNDQTNFITVPSLFGWEDLNGNGNPDIID